MKELLLVRHAKSSWKNPNLVDKERPLNNRGKRDAPKMGQFCLNKGITLDAIFSSPAKRAHLTALEFHSTFHDSVDAVSIETDLYFGSLSDWLWLINNVDESIKCPAFFSHNPTITMLANEFSDDLIDNIPTCGVVYLRSTADNWSDLDYDNTVIKDLFFPKLVLH